MFLRLFQASIDPGSAVAAAGMALGATLWLAGARFSRSAITLLAVALGTEAGLHLPAWLGWSIDGMGTAIGGAVLLGLSGYLLHRGWIAAALGLVLAAWAWLLTSIVCGHGLQWPGAQNVNSLTLRNLTSILAVLTTALHIACASGIVLGILLTIFWPRFSQILAHSLLGVSLLLIAGLWMLQQRGSGWTGALPARASTQLLVLIGLAALGVLVQWCLMPKAGAVFGTNSPASRTSNYSPAGMHFCRAGAD